MLVKEKLYKVIDGITDESRLEAFYSLLKVIESNSSVSVYNSLSTEQKKELDLSYNASLETINLIDHETVKAKLAKWL